jgi:tetratricopeptide (TPR) repeat protein
MSGTLQKDNAAALPHGLSGIYERALPSSDHPAERQRFLEFFGVWALLKKEVSAEFVSSALEGWTEAKVLDEITRNSKWFNVLAGGRYSLYHERLRSFLQQRISKNQFRAINDAIIVACRQALEEKKGDEWEFYALEHLSSHLLLPAMETGKKDELKALAYDTGHWNRQIEISKDFEWSKRMLSDMMLWASKYDDEEVIECALNQVDLHHLEQNDGPRIVELVKQNDMETALHRIKAFGGNDKEGLQRKFTLYMLCLMELTLLESKDLPLRKEAIEKLLKHLDENLPVDHSVLNWNDFFPSYTIFLMAFDWAELGQDYSIIFKRTDNWGKEWIKEKGPYTVLQFEILLECARGISDESHKSSALKDISTKLAQQGKVDEALTYARGISNDSDKSSALKEISAELAKQGKDKECLECARGISNDYYKSSALKDISAELTKQEKIEEAASAMLEALEFTRGISDENWKSIAMKNISAELAEQGKIEEAIEFARGISKDYWRSSALTAISKELAKQGKVDEALAYARGISDESDKSNALKDISAELDNQGKIGEATSAMKEAFACALRITDESDKSRTLKDISSALDKLGNAEEAASAMQEALASARGIGDESDKSCALKDISNELATQGKLELATSAMQEALACARSISHDIWQSSALKDISTELTKQGKVDEALASTRGISNESYKNRSLKNISTELAKQAKIIEAKSVMQESLAYAKGIRDYRKSSTLTAISTELVNRGKLDEALACARGIRDKAKKISTPKDIGDESKKSRVLTVISTELAKQGKVDKATSAMQEALASARGLSDIWKSDALVNLSTELAKQAKADEAASAMQESLACARGISDESVKSSAFKGISIELAKQGKLDEALASARAISDDYWKNSALQSISGELTKKGQFEEAETAMREALECARGISLESSNHQVLQSISGELAKQGKFEESFECARSISDDDWKEIALGDISVELAKQENWSLAEKTGFEILQIANRHDCWKQIAKSTCEKDGWQKALQNANHFRDPEARSHYLKNLAELVPSAECHKDLLLDSRQYYQEDISSMEKILYQHALHELFFEDASADKIHRFDRTLNIQWAIDLRNSFPPAN